MGTRFRGISPTRWRRRKKQKLIKEVIEDPKARRGIRDEMLAQGERPRIPAWPIDQIINPLRRPSGRRGDRPKIRQIKGKIEKLERQGRERGRGRRFSERQEKDSPSFSDAERNGFEAITRTSTRRIRTLASITSCNRVGRPTPRSRVWDEHIGRTRGRLRRIDSSRLPRFLGQKRFLSTIARRLDQLGAITKRANGRLDRADCSRHPTTLSRATRPHTPAMEGPLQ